MTVELVEQPKISTARKDNNIIRTMVRSAYDLQKIRIQMGNRITINWKAKLGVSVDGKKETDLKKEDKKVLDKIRASYKRFTDGVVVENKIDLATYPDVVEKLPTRKKFVGDEIITNYTELTLVDHYMTILKNEEHQFGSLDNSLKGMPIYDQFLSQVRGVGPAMAAIIISEIDIHRAEYPSSLWKYCGVDVVRVGIYTDASGKECIISAEDVESYYGDVHFDEDQGDFYTVNGSLVNRMTGPKGEPVTWDYKGRSLKKYCLVTREYTNKEGVLTNRMGITYNPFLKTKLIGVLGNSFLRSGIALVDGVKMGGLRRAALAKEEGFVAEVYRDEDVEFETQKFLVAQGHKVIIEPSEYGQIYYDYKNRLENSPHHKEKSDGHRHAMALRYAVKRFLVQLYLVWRDLEKLPVATEYSEGVLGMIHLKAGGGKQEYKAA